MRKLGFGAGVLLTLIPLSNAASLPTATAGGSVAGHIKFLEAIPKPEKLLINRDADVCGVTKKSDSFLVSPKTKGLRNVVLSVEGVQNPPRLQEIPTARIIQQGCMYSPHIQVATVGAALQITNKDNLLHNIHSYLLPSKRTLFNLAQPIQNQVTKVVLKDDGVIHVKCDVHNWMSAYIVVKSHPYVALSDENGTFRINQVPPGSYTLRAWHEELGSMDKEVTIEAGKETQIDFEIGK